MDNHHVYISESQASCGIIELSRLSSDPRKVLFAIASRLYHPARGNPASFILWSDVKDSNGVKFMKYVEVTRLHSKNSSIESVKQGKWIENPKTGNEITWFMWEIPHKWFKIWYNEERIRKIKKQQ